jgi:Periplasmic copper-binding protein (NosD)
MEPFRSPFFGGFAMLLRKIAFAFAILFCAGLNTSPGDAGTLYVAGYGTGAAPCAATAPCAQLTTALNAANPGDTIVCVSPPQPTGFTITKSITIDCSTARAPVREVVATSPDGGFDGIVINVAVTPNDPLPTKVRLRGLTLDGAFRSQAAYLYSYGIEIYAATLVEIEDCVISNVRALGIYDHRSGGQTKLFIKDSIISGNGGAGIVAVSAAVGITVLDNVRSEYNAYGIAVGTGNNVEINRSVFSGNSTAGVEGDAGSHIVVSNSTISHNNNGVQSASSVRVYNNDISFNNAAFSGPAGTMGLNRYSSNVSMGTAPSTIPGAPADIGP